mmetsp:Transcript_8573/g.14462  ORF Transcript_8573/g.14462 Transcript_8573/m.14462 type:complete len:198 (+) Transcript_8573:148-741(+)
MASAASPSAVRLRSSNSGLSTSTNDSHECDLSTDHADGQRDYGLTARLQELLLQERTAHVETQRELQVERAAHDETAEKMVEMQHKLEVTLQELANLERYVKRQQQAKAPAGLVNKSAVEKLLREEAYLKSRLVYVQQEVQQIVSAENSESSSKGRRISQGAAGSVSSPDVANASSKSLGPGAKEAEERVLDTALSI